MSKRVAVLVRQRQAEALRVAAGLTLAGDEVDAFLWDGPLAESDEVAQQLETAELADITVRSLADQPDSGPDTARLAELLLEYDLVIPY
ncbi:MAG: hypothetical protein ACYDAG_12170 [Chloroflexota bacterium]